MKKIIMILILLATLVSAKTDRITLERYESHAVNDRNVTILNIDDKNDKVVVCVNNVKNIVSGKEEKIVNGARIDIKRVSKDSVNLEINVDTTGICTDECSNSLCLECIGNLDCDDHNENTQDLCTANRCVFKRLVKEEEKEQVIEEKAPIEISAEFEKEENRNNLLLPSFLVIIVAIVIIIILIKLKK